MRNSADQSKRARHYSPSTLRNAGESNPHGHPARRMDYSRRLLSRFRPPFRHRHDLFVCRSLKRREHDHWNGLALRPAVLRVKTIALAETLLAEPDQHRDVALHRELGLLPADAHVENCVPTFEHFAQPGFAEM